MTRDGEKYAAEFIGTFGLVFAGTGAIIINDVSGGAVSNVGIGLTFGMIVLAMIRAVGDVSGAHLSDTRIFQHLTNLWICLVASVTGALIAVAGCRCVRKDCCSVPLRGMIDDPS
jgi:glycerol uptake facilitator-like aquaporin